MNKIQDIWHHSYSDYLQSDSYQSDVQEKTSSAILSCKTAGMGCNISQCSDCGYTHIHYNSCRNRNCPNCQAVKKEVWVDIRRSEVIDAPYFHVVFTLPHELNSLLYCNQKLLYGLLHRCCAETLLELSKDKKYLGATPGIIQVLHTWSQDLSYHVHMHCIISGGGLTSDKKIRRSSDKFFIPVHVLRDKFKGKYLHFLDSYYQSGMLVLSDSCRELRNSYSWKEFKDSLYQKDWCPFIKKTFKGFGNAIEYLGRYTHRIAISNSRIVKVTENKTTFSARALHQGEPRRMITLDNTEFIRRFLMHVLPHGFQKIRYYGFLNNRMKKKNLRIIFRLQGKQAFKRKLENRSVAEILKIVWNVDINRCPCCNSTSMHCIGRTYAG